nr:MAG: RNA-dependent RNA polymerase [Owegonang virus 2]
MENSNQNITDKPTELFNVDETSKNVHGQKTVVKMTDSNQKITAKPTEFKNNDGISANEHGQLTQGEMKDNNQNISSKPTVITYEELKALHNGQIEFGTIMTTQQNSHGPKNEETMKSKPEENILPDARPAPTMKFILKIRSYETEYGYIEVTENFPGYEFWKYRIQHNQAKQAYKELCDRKSHIYKEILNVLRCMKWSMGQNDFVVPMATYNTIMELKGKETLMTKNSFDKFVAKITSLTTGIATSTIWSQHKDFDMRKRVAFRLNGTKMPKITTFDEFLVVAENYGLFKNSNNFRFINRNKLIFRFNGINYFYNEVDSDLIKNVSNSVHNQPMSLKDIVVTATVVTTLKLTEFTPSFTHFEDILVNTLMVLIDILRQLTVKASVDEIVNEILQTPIIIPVENVDSLKEYMVLSREAVKSLFVAKRLVINDRETAEQAEKEEGILMNGTPVKFHVNDTEIINVMMTDIPDTDEMKVFEEIVHCLEETGTLRDSIISGYNLSKSFKMKVLTFNKQLGRVLPTKDLRQKVEMEVFSDTIYVHLTDQLVRKTIVNDNHPGLMKLRRKLLTDYQNRVEELIPLKNLTQSAFLEILLDEHPDIVYYQKLRERYSRSLSYFMAIATRNVFSNILSLRKLVEDLISRLKEEGSKPVKQDDNYIEHGLMDAVYYPLNLTRHHYNNLKGTCNSIYETITSTQKLTGVVGEAMEEVKATALKLANKLEGTGMNNTSRSIINMDVHSFKSSFASTKIMMSAVFNDIVNKIGGVIGLEPESDVDAYQLFVYYILWRNTDCKITKTMIVIDIMAAFGILDKAWEILTWLFKKTVAIGKSIFTYTDHIGQSILDFEKEVEQKIVTEEVPIEKPHAQTEEEETSFFSDVISSLESGAPHFLAMLATGALAAFGMRGLAGGVTVEKFNQSLKNIGLIGLAITQVPKIYQNILKVVLFVFDQAKAVINKEHETEIALVRRMGKFLQNASYVVGVSETVMMQDISYCFKFNSDFAEMLDLDKHFYKIKDPALRSAFVIRKNAMEKMHPTAEAAISILLPRQELFHVQICSAPGLGKTDLSHKVMLELHQEKTSCLKKTMEAAGIKYEDRHTEFSYYPSNDGLKFMDNYRGQDTMYVDEENISTEFDAEKTLMKLMMGSGAPVITNQASLTDKGRVLELSIKVSNTNNAFVRTEGLLCPESMWRRRLLFEAKLKPEYETNGKLDKDKATTEIISKSKHLVIEWMDAVRPNQRADPKIGKMEVDEFLYLVRVLYRRHYTREMNRANIKTPKANYLKLQHISNMVSLYNQMRKNVNFKALKTDYQSLKEEALKLNKDTEEILEDLKASTEDEQLEKIKTVDTKQMCKEMKEKILVAEAANADEDRQKVLTAISSLAKTLSVTLEQDQVEIDAKVSAATKSSDYKEHGLLTFEEEWTNFTLEHKTVGSDSFYMLKPVKEPRTMKNGPIEWNLLEIQKVGKEDRIIYKGNVTPENEDAILYHMVNLSTYSKSGAEAKILIEKENLKLGEKSNMYAEKMRLIIEDTFRTVSNALKSIYNRVYGLISNGFLRGIVMGISVFVMFVTLGGIGKLLLGKENYEEHIRYNKVNRANKKNVTEYFDHSEQVEAEVDDLHYYKSMIKLSIHKGNYVSVGTGIALTGYTYLINRHVAKELEDHEVVRICDVHKVEKDPTKSWRQVNIGKIVYIPDADAAVVVIKDTRMLRSCLKHFITEEEMSHADEEFGNTQVKALLICKQNCPGKVQGYHHHTTKFMDIHAGYSRKHKRIYHFRNHTDQIRPTFGDSGSVIIHNNLRLSHKILGIYNGNSEIEPLFGVCGVITQEEIKKALQQIPEEEKIVTFPYQGEYVDCHELQSVLKYDKVLMKSPITNQAVSKTLGFMATGCFKDKIEVEPAIQSRSDIRFDPSKRHFMEVSLNKDNGDVVPFIRTEEEVKMKEFIKTTMKENWNWQSVRLYSTEQAVNGVRKTGSRPIDIHSSAGLPYKLRAGVQGKQPFIRYSDEQQRYIIKEELLSNVAYKKSLFKMGLVSQDMKLEFRKHELVGHKKIYEKPKTRTVGMGNMEDQIIYDENFKDLHTGMKSVYRRGLSSSYVMGLDLEVHASQVVKHLKYIDYILDFDVEAWEEKFSRQIGRIVMESNFEIIKEAYDINKLKLPEKQLLMLLTLLDDSIYSNVIYEDTVRTRLSGLLSGWPGTLPDNSKAHLGLIYLIIYRILLRKGKKHLANVTYMMHHVRAIVAADDVCLALSPEIRQLISVEEIQAGYMELGYNITAPDKSVHIKARTIYEIEFLKHNFYQKNGVFYTKVMDKVIYQLLGYIRTTTKLPVKVQMQVNVTDAMRFAFWHGPDFYEELRKQVNMEFAKHEISWNRTYEEMEILVKHLIEQEQNNDSLYEISSNIDK